MAGAKSTWVLFSKSPREQVQSLPRFDLLYYCEHRGEIHSGVRISDRIDDRCKVHQSLVLSNCCESKYIVYIGLDLL